MNTHPHEGVVSRGKPVNTSFDTIAATPAMNIRPKTLRKASQWTPPLTTMIGALSEFGAGLAFTISLDRLSSTSLNSGLQGGYVQIESIKSDARHCDPDGQCNIVLTRS